MELQEALHVWCELRSGVRGGDFGGIAAWNQKGVAGALAARTADLTEMRNYGVDVVRWMVFPTLVGDGIALDSAKSPSGLGATVVDDINTALEIAATLDVHLKLTLFSFDGFWGEHNEGGRTVSSLQPIATDSSRRAALLKNVIAPIARAVEASPYKDHMVSWDVIEEPEWAIAGSDSYGDPAFEPTVGDSSKPMLTVTHLQMETFIREVVSVLHANSSALVTVGGASIKWAKAWSNVGLDFYEFHWFGWSETYWSHTKTPSEYGIADKPVVVGAFPLVPSVESGFGTTTYARFVDDVFAAGYAGVQGWSFNDGAAAFSWSAARANVKSWADANSCISHF